MSLCVLYIYLKILFIIITIPIVALCGLEMDLFIFCVSLFIEKVLEYKKSVYFMNTFAHTLS